MSRKKIINFFLTDEALKDSLNKNSCKNYILHIDRSDDLFIIKKRLLGYNKKPNNYSITTGEPNYSEIVSINVLLDLEEVFIVKKSELVKFRRLKSFECSENSIKIPDKINNKRLKNKRIKQEVIKQEIINIEDSDEEQDENEIQIFINDDDDDDYEEEDDEEEIIKSKITLLKAKLKKIKRSKQNKSNKKRKRKRKNNNNNNNNLYEDHSKPPKKKRKINLIKFF